MNSKFSVFSIVFFALALLSPLAAAEPHVKISQWGGWLEANGNGTINASVWYGNLNITVPTGSSAVAFINKDAIVKTDGTGTKTLVGNNYKYEGFGSLNASSKDTESGMIYANITGTNLKFRENGWWISAKLEGKGTYKTSNGRRGGWPAFIDSGSGTLRVSGRGWISANGTGSINGTGRGIAIISSIGSANSVLIVSDYATVTKIGGTATSLGDGTTKYEGFSALNLTVLPPYYKAYLYLNGSDIKFYGEGWGTLTLNGTGSVATFKNKSKAKWDSAAYPVKPISGMGFKNVNGTGNGSIRLTAFYGVFEANATSGSINVKLITKSGPNAATINTEGTGTAKILTDGSTTYSGYGKITIDSTNGGISARATGKYLEFNASNYFGTMYLVGNGSYTTAGQTHVWSGTAIKAS